MNFKICLFAILLLGISGCTTTGTVKRAAKALEKEKFEKAEQLLSKTLDKDTINPGAHYTYARLYTVEQYEGFNIDSAYYHVNTAIDHFSTPDLSEKSVKKLNKLGINDTTLQQQKAAIEELAFQHVLNTNTIAAYNYFIQHYSTAKEEPEARRIRNELAFKKAREMNTYDAYKHFLDTYPDAVQIQEASELYEFLLYENKTKPRTLSSYVNFLKDYPNTNYTLDALENIFELYTVSNEPESYLKFIQDYPANPLSKKATDYLYHLIKSRQGVSYFQKHYDYLINDSLRTVMAIDNSTLFPIYENDLYGFKNDQGKVVIQPQFTSIDEDYLCGEIPENILMAGIDEQQQIYTHLGKSIHAHHYFSVESLTEGLLLINDKGKYGLLHVAGYTVVPPVHDSISLLNHQYVKYKEKEKWGLLSYAGRKITGPYFDDIFAEGPFVLFENAGRLGVANDQYLFEMANQGGKRILFDYDDIVLLDNSTILGVDNNTQVVLNESLLPIIPKSQHQVYRLEDGWLIGVEDKFNVYDEELIPLSNASFTAAYYKGNLLALKRESKWALVDLEENTFPEFRYDSLNIIGEKFAIGTIADSTFVLFQHQARQQLTKSQTIRLLKPSTAPVDSAIEYLLVNNANNFKTLYNSLGEKIIAGQYSEVNLLGRDLFIVEKNGKKGLANTLGEIVLPIRFDGIGNYAEGNISTLRSQKFGLFNALRDITIPPEYDVTIKPYNDSLFVASKNRQYGLIDKANKTVLPFKFEEVQPWNDSLALVKTNSSWHIYHLKTKEPVLEDISSLKFVPLEKEETQAIIRKDDRYGVISSRNLSLLPPAYDDILNLGNKGKPIYFAEKRVKEAELYVVIYYNDVGETIHKQTFSEQDYDNIYCY